MVEYMMIKEGSC